MSAELGYWLGERFWGRGLATAAIRGFVPWAFDALHLERIAGERGQVTEHREGPPQHRQASAHAGAAR